MSPRGDFENTFERQPTGDISLLTAFALNALAHTVNAYECTREFFVNPAHKINQVVYGNKAAENIRQHQPPSSK